MKKNLGWIIPTFAVVFAFVLFFIYFLGAKVDIIEEKTNLYIYPNTTKSEVVKTIESQNIIINSVAFKFYSLVFNYKTVHSGCYEIEKGLSVGRLVHKLAKGRQTPIKLVLGKSRTKEEFAETIDNDLAFSKKELLSKMNDNEFLKSFGVDSITVLSLFIPNTYEVYWNITIDDFFKRMGVEQDRFWRKREDKLKAIGYNKLEVLTIASIVEEETNMNDEKPIVAAVYINRLKKGMPLQADPTIKFALGDFTIKRIVGKMLGVESPYNTYRNLGLPPAPICIPSIASIDAVLNYEKNDYLFFCAREDFSGYHNFTSDIKEHYANARKYQAALNELEILE
ncbi:MAG: endolytic transglycosylase MltG [Bacteroidales bacterium]|nr:endolytic transglycosylase MltG [Bacteroidales bacterium]